jgi:RimJ/RimL family protein N-acetyltransferase
MSNEAATSGPADYPDELDEELVLPNQKRLRIRPLYRDEESTVRDLYAHLSPRTRYRRFFSPMPTLPDTVLRLLVSVDHRRRLALVAQYEHDSEPEIVGLGSFGAIDDDSAELALVVRDEWQSQRVGTALADRVLRAAEDRGFHRFAVHLFSDNLPARRILARLGVVIASKASGGIAELVFVPPSRS